MLLICDPEGGSPKSFYSMKGSIGGNCEVYCCTFDAEGNLIEQTDTGNTVPYRR